MASFYTQEMGSHKHRRSSSSICTTPSDIVGAFNTWQFKREQPDNLEELIKTTAHAVDHLRPIPFVLYWGKGRRDTADVPELQCLDYLAKLSDKLSTVYPPGTAMTLILTDTHAELNGYSENSISRYFSAVDDEARRRDISTVRLSAVVQSQLESPATGVAEQISPEQLSELVRSAEKWYRGNDSPEHGAMAYYRANMLERYAVQRAYPKAIFITFNGRSHRYLFPPALPVFYMYSIRKGVAVKPWFIDNWATDE